jgi:hypothetical protein
VYVEQDGSLHEFSNTGGSPSSIAIDHLNQLYVCDLAHGAVILIKDDGSQVVVHDYEGQAFKVRNWLSARDVLRCAAASVGTAAASPAEWLAVLAPT